MLDNQKNVGELKPYLNNKSVRWNSICYEELPKMAIPNSELSRYSLSEGDVLVCEGGEVGRAALWDAPISECYYQKALHRLRTFGRFQPKLIISYLKLFSEKGLFEQYVGQTSIAHLTKEKLSIIPIPLPPLEEQEAIAEALSDADALVDALERLLWKKRRIKEGAMQELLTGRTRLLGFSGAWETKRLGEVFDVSGGLSASRAQLGDEGYCYLHYGDIHSSSKAFISVLEEFSVLPKLPIGLKNVPLSAMLKDGDVVFVDASEDEEGASKHIVVVNPRGQPFISGLHTIVAKSKTAHLCNLYKRYCFQTSKVKEQFRFYSVGTKVLGVNKSNIVKISILVPPLEEQEAIAEVLCGMDEEIEALEEKLAKARRVKQGMMQELLTGRIRLR